MISLACFAIRKQRKETTMKRRTFTLIELLVVIAIIAILAAMLLPVLNKARDMGREAQCLSNNKNLGTSWLMYSQDNNAYFPDNTNQGHSGQTHRSKSHFLWCTGDTGLGLELGSQRETDQYFSQSIPMCGFGGTARFRPFI